MDERDSITQNPVLSAEQRGQLMSFMVARIGTGEFGDEVKDKKARVRVLAGETRVRIVHLSDANESEVILQAWDWESGLCGATGNCQTFVLRKRGARWQTLLEASAQRIRVLESTTGGYHDLLFATHDSAFESDVNIYRFVGGRYRRVACYDVDWQSRMVPLRVPEVSPCGAGR